MVIQITGRYTKSGLLSIHLPMCVKIRVGMRQNQSNSQSQLAKINQKLKERAQYQ